MYVCVTSGSALSDGQWHSVEVVSGQGHLSVAVDGDDGAFTHTSSPFLITTGSQFFFGGKMNIILCHLDRFRVHSPSRARFALLILHPSL